MAQRLIVFIFVVFTIISSALAQEARWKAEGWKTDFSISTVNYAEILSGGPPKDGIPPIDKPKFIAVVNETELTDRDPVIGLSINGDARAYPLRILTWHEIVNDTVGGKAVAVTYCPLCNAAIVFDATVDGKPQSFGTTGKLRNSDLIMYDRETESWWQQFTGEGIAGLNTGKKLKLIASRIESWADFKKRFPDGKVLVPNNRGFRNYGRNPYVNYDISATPFLYNGSMPKGISPMARVVVIKRDQKPPLVVSLQHLRDKRSLTLNGYKLSWKAGQASALHTGEISKGRDVGGVIVKNSSTDEDVAYDVTFAFVSHAFHPNIKILK